MKVGIDISNTVYPGDYHSYVGQAEMQLILVHFSRDDKFLEELKELKTSPRYCWQCLTGRDVLSIRNR